MAANRDNAGVRVSPPLIVIAVLLIGISLDRLSPIGFVGAVVPRSWRATLATALVIFAAWPLARALIGFRRVGTPPEPWRTTTAQVVRGIYSRTRNPIYQGYALFVLGLAFAFASDWAFLLFPLGALMLHFGVVRREERYLAARFGEDYRRYCATVPRYGWPV